MNLTDTFDKLREEGLLAEMDFGCCKRCASVNCWKILEEEDEEKGGFVYFSGNDTVDYFRSENEGRNLWLGFGGDNPVEVAEVVCDTLRECGYGFIWKGDVQKRIVVKNVAMEDMEKVLIKASTP